MARNFLHFFGATNQPRPWPEEGGRRVFMARAEPEPRLPPQDPPSSSPPPGAQRRMHRPTDQQAGSRTGGTHGMFGAGAASGGGQRGAPARASRTQTNARAGDLRVPLH